MSSQLDILALEPFYGGIRRSMLETVIRCSRHRWTLLKLPPRRIEQRLTAAANWFAEQLSRHWAGRVDLLFTSEAMNLANLYRLVPGLARQPSVVYFHDNQMPDVQAACEGPLDLVNLNTAMAASEIWFNTLFHLRTFLGRASKLVERHTELSSRDPMPHVTAKAHVMPPPMDLNLIGHIRATQNPPPRDASAIFVETRDADLRLLNETLRTLSRRGTKFRLITVGPVEDLSIEWQRRTISETDEHGQIAGLWEAGVIVSVKPRAPFDHQIMRGILAGCRPLLPDTGVYPELLPAALHDDCLYPVGPEALANDLEEAMASVPTWQPPESRSSLRRFEAIAATRAFDDRLDQIMIAQSAGK